jgi:hypothetical protein
MGSHGVSLAMSCFGGFIVLGRALRARIHVLGRACGADQQRVLRTPSLVGTHWSNGKSGAKRRPRTSIRAEGAAEYRR